jgi:hypothetical protein
MMTLVFDVPRYVQGTSDETGEQAGDYETSSTAPNPSDKVPSEAIPAAEQDDHDENGNLGSTDSLISP